jgi:hypothetical protein
MGRVLLLTVLGLGAIFGFTSGFRHVSHGEYGWGPPWSADARMHSSRIDAMAEACVRAARGATPAQSTPAQSITPTSP